VAGKKRTSKRKGGFQCKPPGWKKSQNPTWAELLADDRAIPRLPPGFPNGVQEDGSPYQGPGSSEHPFDSFDVFELYFSGGKDSFASFWMLLACAYAVGGSRLVESVRARTRFSHQLVDGREGTSFGPTLWDWPITEDYCVAAARRLGVPLVFSWRKRGIEGELLKATGSARLPEYPWAPETTQPMYFEPLLRPHEKRCGTKEVLAIIQDLRKWDETGLRSVLKRSGFNEDARDYEIARATFQENEQDRCSVHPDGRLICCGGAVSTEPNTRLKWPAIASMGSEDPKAMSKRWCTGWSKIYPSRKAITSDPRNDGKKICTISGERAEESPSRAPIGKRWRPDATYAQKREVWRWRPVHHLLNYEVWRIMGDFQIYKGERMGINPHPCYDVGFGRCSCCICIFGLERQWATLKALDPARFDHVVEQERLIGHTIKKVPMDQYVKGAKPYPFEPWDQLRVMSYEWGDPVFTPTEKYPLPSGWCSENAGPT